MVYLSKPFDHNFYFKIFISVHVFNIEILDNFRCLVDINNETSNDSLFVQIYENILVYYQVYGLYLYDPNILRVEFTNDMASILLGSLALNTFTIFNVG